MKATAYIQEKFGVDEATANALIANAKVYTNQGKGQVARNGDTIKKVANLFNEKSIWLSPELNERVGWQFSQAIFWLRKRGWVINTVSFGHHIFGYQLIQRPDGIA